MHPNHSENYTTPDSHTILLLEAMEGILAILDMEGKIVAVHSALNQPAMPSSSRLIGQYWFDLFKSIHDNHSSENAFKKTIQEYPSNPLTCKFQLSDGKSFLLQWHLKPVVTAADGSTCIWAVGQKLQTFPPKTEELDRNYLTLIEKNRELTALYGISQIIVDVERPFEEKLIAITDLLLPVFRFPEKAEVYIRLDGVEYGTAGFETSLQKLTENVIVRDEKRGIIQVGYSFEIPPQPEQQTFLVKEQQFLQKVARLLAFKLEKRELADQLKHADRLATIGQLAAGIAHELNNPLTDILGFSQLASSQPDLPEETYEDLEKIVKSALYAREVIKKVLFFSRQSHPKVIMTNLNRMIAEWMEFFRKRCDQNGIEIILDLDPNLPTTRCDPGQLNQVLVNLVVNAIHAMPNGGTLSIRTGTAGKSILVAIQDTGTGIKAEIFNKIFLPFFTTKEVDQGTGLGLCVVYGIIKEHGGTISVHSLEGEGSTFEVRLPHKTG